MIFAAGLGTRLRPLTEYLPKPAVPVVGRPLVSFAIDCVRRAGITDITLNTHYMADAVREHVARAAPSVHLRYSHEPELLGTAGGLRNAFASRLREFADGEAVCVMNSDMLFDIDLRAAVESHERSGAIATLVLRSNPEPSRYGSVAVDDEGRVSDIAGLRGTAAAAGRALMFTGVHVVSAQAVASLPLHGCIIRDAYVPWLSRGAVIQGVLDESPFRDLGTVNDYFDANIAFARGEWSWPGLDRSAAIADDVACGINNVSVHDSVIGSGVRVAADVTLERVVAWRGARIDRSLCDAIVTSDGTIVRVGR